MTELQPELKIYKASAGSGKTFLLAGQYLELALLGGQDFEYRHILAITFTRKSTAEMKRRILDELHTLSNGEPSAHLTSLLTKAGERYTETQLREKAGRVLRLIMHDYSRFHIATIDSFLQRLVRSFARESGLSSGYLIELDEKKVLETVTGEMLDELEEGTELAYWLSAFSKDQAEEGSNWNIHQKLQEFLSKTRKEHFLLNEILVLDSIQDQQQLLLFMQTLKTRKQEIEQNLVQIGRKALEICNKHGLHPELDFKGGKNTSMAKALIALENNPLKEPTATFLRNFPEPESWVHAKPLNSSALVTEVCINELYPLAQQYVEIMSDEMRYYYAAKLILDNFYQFGITAEFLRKLRQYRDEHDVMLISDTAAFLYKIVNRNDQSFLYEKAGNLFKHFLVDEFQDTSGLQWENLKPLIRNALAEGHSSLLVGDVKQAIYRFRSGDWNLLLQAVEKDPELFGQQVYNLPYNWRSLEEIIRFNNRLFEVLPSIFQDVFTRKMDEMHIPQKEDPSIFTKAYLGHEQQPGNPEEQKGGYISLSFFQRGETLFEELALERMALLIDDAITRGYKQEEICILVRKNAECTQVTEFILSLEDRDYKVVSEISTLLVSSASVRIIMEALRYVLADKKSLYLYGLANEYHHYLGKEEADETISSLNPEKTAVLKTTLDQHLHFLSGLTLQGFIEETIRLFQLQEDLSELPYIQALRNVAMEYSNQADSSLQRFLDHWDENYTTLSVDAPPGGEAIRIMTINKSKGLEFPVVIIPFCNFAAAKEGNHKEVLWVETEGTSYDKYPLIPVDYGSSLARSEFYTQYAEETASLLLDKLNLLYVAFTRAERELHIVSELPKTDKSESRVGILLNRAIKSTEGGNEEEYYEIGTPTSPGKKEKKTADPYLVQQHISETYTGRISVKPLSKEMFVAAGSEAGRKIEYGRLIHEVLEKLKDATQLDLVLKSFLLEGKIIETDLAEIKGKLTAFLDQSPVKEWFSTGQVFLAERALLIPGEKIKIPDRVLLGPGKTAIILEFKTGQEEDIHAKQVQEYINAYTTMGFQATGFILYTETLHIKPILCP